MAAAAQTWANQHNKNSKFIIFSAAVRPFFCAFAARPHSTLPWCCLDVNFILSCCRLGWGAECVGIRSEGIFMRKMWAVHYVLYSHCVVLDCVKKEKLTQQASRRRGPSSFDFNAVFFGIAFFSLFFRHARLSQLESSYARPVSRHTLRSLPHT